MQRVSHKCHGGMFGCWEPEVVYKATDLMAALTIFQARRTTDGIMFPPLTTENEVAYRPQLQSVCSSVIDDFTRPLFTSRTFPKPSKSRG